MQLRFVHRSEYGAPVLYPVTCRIHPQGQLVQRSLLSQDTQYHRSHRNDGDSVHLEETLLARSRTIEKMRRVRGVRVIPAQSRRNKVRVGFGGIRRGEDLNVGIRRVRRAAVDKVAVVQQKVYVRY